MDQNETTPQLTETENVEKLRRFALAIGTGLLIYVIGGGEIREEIQIPVAAIVHFKRPWVLSSILIIVSLYSTYRYWYHGIHRPLTRNKIRKWFYTAQPVLFFGGTKSVLDNFENNAEGPLKKSMYQLFRTIPDGILVQDCVVLTRGLTENQELKDLAAKKLDTYFTGITGDNIEIGMYDGTPWAKVASKSLTTRWHCWMEDLDLWLPVIVNVLAVFLFFTFPWLISTVEVMFG